jgi:hypothetical protein
VELLTGEGLTSSTGKPFTLEMISWIRYKHRIPGPLPPAGTLSVRLESSGIGRVTYDSREVA